MRKIMLVLLSVAMLLLGAACGAETPAKKTGADAPKAQPAANAAQDTGNKNAAKNTAAGSIKLKVTANGKTLTAVMEDNPTTQAFMKKLPVTLKMENLYQREMCYRYGGGTFPTGTLRSDRYEVGDIIYWPPRGSFVILYAQNGEEFERQHMGHISGNVSFFRNTGDVDVTFELLKE